MELFYWRAERGNFGDDLNGWIWDELIPGWREWAPDVSLIGVGSLLTTNLPLPAGRKIVAGAGAGYGAAPVLAPAEDWDVRFVRGPLTAAALGLPASAGIIDTAALCARLPRFAARGPSSRRPVFIPHWESDVSPEYDWRAICTAAGVDWVSPRGNAAGVIHTIASAPLVLAESLHAAIIADAFRVPWRPVRTGIGHMKVFKWEDWTASLGVPLEISDIMAPMTRLRRLLRPGRGQALPALVGAASMGWVPASGQAPAPPPPKRPGTDLRNLIRDRLRLEVAARGLHRAARAPAFLSADAVLDDRLDRAQTALNGITRDYGGLAAGI